MKKFFALIIFFVFTSLNAMNGQSTNLNNINLWWEGHGNTNNPPVLLIMGLNANLKRWPDELISGLVNEGFYVITFDNRDSGKSSWVTKEPSIIKFIKILPSFIQNAIVEGLFSQMFDEEGRFLMGGAPSEYNLSDMAQDGIALLDHLGINKAHIVGASMGGMIAQVIALDHPERVHTFTGIMTTPGFDTKGLSGPTLEYVEAMKKSFKLSLQNEHKESMYVGNSALLGTRYPDDGQSEKLILLTMEHGNNNNSGHMAAVGASPNRMHRLKTIAVPSLIIHGSEDPLIPQDHGIAIANEIQNSKLYIMEGVGHNFPIQLIPEIINKLVIHFNEQ